jgi:hypothetical protein
VLIAFAHSKVQLHFLAIFAKSFAFFDLRISTISKFFSTLPIVEMSHNFSTSHPLTRPSGKISTNLSPATHFE